MYIYIHIYIYIYFFFFFFGGGGGSLYYKWVHGAAAAPESCSSFGCSAPHHAVKLPRACFNVSWAVTV